MKQTKYRHYIKSWTTIIIYNTGANYNKQYLHKHPNFDKKNYDKWIEKFCTGRVYLLSGLGFPQEDLEHLGLAGRDEPLFNYLVFSFKDEKDLTMFILKFGDKII